MTTVSTLKLSSLSLTVSDGVLVITRHHHRSRCCGGVLVYVCSWHSVGSWLSTRWVQIFTMSLPQSWHNVVIYGHREQCFMSSNRNVVINLRYDNDIDGIITIWNVKLKKQMDTNDTFLPQFLHCFKWSTWSSHMLYFWSSYPYDIMMINIMFSVMS